MKAEYICLSFQSNDNHSDAEDTMMKLLMLIGAIFLTLRSSHGHNIEKRINASSQYGHNLENDGLELPPEVQIAVEGAGDRSRTADKSLAPTSCLRLKVVYNRPFRNIFGSSTEQRIKSIIDGADKIFGYHGLSTRINLDVEESELHLSANHSL